MAYIHGKVKDNREKKIKLSNFPRNNNASVLFPQLNHVVR